VRGSVKSARIVLHQEHMSTRKANSFPPKTGKSCLFCKFLLTLPMDASDTLASNYDDIVYGKC